MPKIKEEARILAIGALVQMRNALRDNHEQALVHLANRERAHLTIPMLDKEIVQLLATTGNFSHPRTNAQGYRLRRAQHDRKKWQAISEQCVNELKQNERQAKAIYQAFCKLTQQLINTLTEKDAA